MHDTTAYILATTLFLIGIAASLYTGGLL